MKEELVFTPLDLRTWKRGAMFYYFSEMAPTGYSLTTQLDITHLLSVVREHGMKFFPAYLWLVTKNLNGQTECRVAKKDGQVGYYNTLTPLYAAFHEEDKTFSLMWTLYDDSFPEFHKDYLENQERFGKNHGVLAQPDMLPPENAYTVSALPWISFQHFAVHALDSGQKSYYFPSVEAGKFYQAEDGRMYLPLSITCHHAAMDGYHVKCFLEAFQRDADSFECFLD